MWYRRCNDMKCGMPIYPFSYTHTIGSTYFLNSKRRASKKNTRSFENQEYRWQRQEKWDKTCKRPFYILLLLLSSSSSSFGSCEFFHFLFCRRVRVRYFFFLKFILVEENFAWKSWQTMGNLRTKTTNQGMNRFLAVKWKRKDLLLNRVLSYVDTRVKLLFLRQCVMSHVYFVPFFYLFCGTKRKWCRKNKRSKWRRVEQKAFRFISFFSISKSGANQIYTRILMLYTDCGKRIEHALILPSAIGTIRDARYQRACFV